jgi:ribonucleoside-diphosphate reductase alpha chain
VDWDKLSLGVRYAVRFLDNVIDATPYFFEENKKQQLSERRVGLGTMGLAEMMIRLKIRYGSPESVEFLDKLFQFIAVEAYLASADNAAEKGVFAMFDAEKFLQSGFMQGMPEPVRAAAREKGIRNVTLLTQAPTGTTGTMVNTSTGIEPFYFWSFERKGRMGVHEERVGVYDEWVTQNPDQPLPPYFVTAMDMQPEDHVRVQAAIQRWIDSSISKTCNTPHSYTVEQTRELYELMYELGCKGGTIYCVEPHTRVHVEYPFVPALRVA